MCLMSSYIIYNVQGKKVEEESRKFSHSIGTSTCVDALKYSWGDMEAYK